MGNQCTTVDMEPEPRVQVYLTKASQLKEDGNLEGAIKALETAKENSTKIHVHSIIDDQISELEQQIDSGEMLVVAANRRKEPSDEDTERFNEGFLKLQEHLSRNEFKLANGVLKTLMEETDFEAIKSVGTYLALLMDNHVCNEDAFRMYDTEQQYHLKQNLLVLLRNVAFASFQRNDERGIKLDPRKEHNLYMPSIESHESFYKKQETKLSYTPLLFQLSYTKDIIPMMDTTESFTDKINAGAAMKNIALDCIALNLPGAIQGAMTHLGKNLAKVALEH